MKKRIVLILLVAISIVACKEDKIEDLSPSFVSEEGERLSGGEVTITDQSVNAFGLQAPALSGEQSLLFFVGNSLFTQNWVTAPASTTARDGLGPLFNSRACSGCHPKDGRSMPPQFEGDVSHGLLLRLSIPGFDTYGGPLDEPTYGGQLQPQSILGVMNEGQFSVLYTENTGTYPDGATYSLRVPFYSIKQLNYGEMSSSVLVSPRVGQQVYGLGLLEALTEKTILEYADESDVNNDGVSGKPNYVWDFINGKQALGRFGWKANQPSLKQQAAGAFVGDMGITSSLFNNENCPSGVNCDTIKNGGRPEIEADNLNNVTLYLQTLAVPARRNWESQTVLKGKDLFFKAGCETCHRAIMKTSDHPISVLSNQTIRPYTDLLLHDMGTGLADNRPDYLANGNEWRTPPLWGIGLLQTVNGHTNLLHDGRARTFEEAILWHGGEAEKSKNNFKSLSKIERNAVITFLESL